MFSLGLVRVDDRVHLRLERVKILRRGHHFKIHSIGRAEAPDAVGKLSPPIFTVLGHAFYFDALYDATFIRLNKLLATISDWLDRWVWNGAVKAITSLVFGFAHLDNFLDTHVVNSGFDEGCESVSVSGKILSRLQAGRVQGYLKIVAGALIVFTIVLLWKARV